MASEAKPPILAAPLEIRFEIYRHAWTIPGSDLHGLSDVLEQQGNPVHLFPEVLYFRLQVKKLHALVSICRQIRDEVLSEHFHRAQVSIYNWRGYNTRLEECIQSSLLFASYTQHVSLSWSTEEPDLMTRIIDWLLQLKQLKTLELTIDWLWPRMKPSLNEILDASLFGRLTTLRNLEKIVVKFHHDSWKETPEAQRIEDILSKSVREDLRQPEEQPTYVFEELIGFDVLLGGISMPHRI